jgi:CheY-like chemotaxis protein
LIYAKDGQYAVRQFEANWQDIALVLLDVVMPALTGPEAYSRMRSIRPDLPVLHAALERPAQEQHLRQVCGGDAWLLEEVRSRLIAKVEAFWTRLLSALPTCQQETAGPASILRTLRSMVGETAAGGF